MSGMEHFLPKEYQFETSLQEVREPLVDDLYGRTYENEDALGDIIDPIREFSRPVEALWKLSEGFTRMYMLPNEDANAVQAATYRGLCFGLQVVDDIRVAPINRISIGYLAKAETGQDAAEMIDTDVAQYLEEHPRIRELLVSFAPDIDPTYQYRHHVDRAAGFAFMVCEREQADQYLAVQQAQLESQITMQNIPEEE